MRIILFGAGGMTERFLENLGEQYEIIAIADNDKLKQGHNIHWHDIDISIIPAKDITEYRFDIVVITIDSFSCQLDIMAQLIKLGVPYEKIKFWRNQKILNAVRVLEEDNTNSKENVIFFDVTHISQNDRKTGIQRVVRELYRNMAETEHNVCPVQCVSDGWITSNGFACNIRNEKFDDVEFKVDISERILFSPDFRGINLELIESIPEGTSSCVVVYDLIPIHYPKVFSEQYQMQFVNWLEKILKFSSKCVCISRTVADDLIAYYKQINVKRNSPLEIYHMHLGFDIPNLQEYVRTEIADFVSRGMTFLIVGTVEVRKNHYLLLNALKQVFAEFPDINIQLLILGKDGWMNDDFKNMYSFDKTIKERVLWIKDSSDSEVQWAYQHCAALTYPPKTEGFGLPLIEAAHFGLPVLCSDIPIFHEVMGEHADYFNVDDVDSLREAIIRWINSDIHPDSGKIKMYTWKECTKEVLDILHGSVVPYEVLY